MALINCTECGKEVSDRAKTCPNCGCPIIQEVDWHEENLANVSPPAEVTQSETSGQSVASAPTVVVKQKEGCFLQTLNTGCMIVAVIIVLLLLGMFSIFS